MLLLKLRVNPRSFIIFKHFTVLKDADTGDTMSIDDKISRLEHTLEEMQQSFINAQKELAPPPAPTQPRPPWYKLFSRRKFDKDREIQLKEYHEKYRKKLAEGICPFCASTQLKRESGEYDAPHDTSWGGGSYRHLVTYSYSQCLACKRVVAYGSCCEEFLMNY